MICDICEYNRSVRRLLKKAQMQGGVTHPFRMGTRRGARLIPLVVSLSNHAAPREGGNAADEPFSAACYAKGAGWPRSFA
jgi:hypothetical protein